MNKEKLLKKAIWELTDTYYNISTKNFIKTLKEVIEEMEKLEILKREIEENK